MKERSLLATAIAGALLVSMGVPNAHGAAALRVESKLTVRNPLVRGELRQVEWTRVDRQALEVDGVLTAMADVPDTVHTRIITRLDLRLVWAINYLDSSYTETSFRVARAAARMLDSLMSPEDREQLGYFGEPESLGVGERMGIAVVHMRRRGPAQMYGPTPKGETRLMKALEWWEARELPELDVYRKFCDARERTVGGAPPDGRDPDTEIEELCRSGTGHRRGHAVWASLTEELGASFPDSIASAMQSDTTAMAMGINLANRTVDPLVLEVVRLAPASAADALFELPPGFKRHSSFDEEMLDAPVLRDGEVKVLDRGKGHR